MSFILRSLEPLPLGDHYWNIRDAIVQSELLLLRMCQFGVKFSHPHKYFPNTLPQNVNTKQIHNYLAYSQVPTSLS